MFYCIYKMTVFAKSNRMVSEFENFFENSIFSLKWFVEQYFGIFLVEMDVTRLGSISQFPNDCFVMSNRMMPEFEKFFRIQF